MDLLKSLLLYLSLTFASSVQVAPLPEDVPTPTAPPVVTAAPAAVSSAPQAAATATLAPAATQTPQPVPAITPNLSYKNLSQGDRGSQVKKLQKRLIELGYLDEGADDGAYGGQTRRAVMRFQYYNGLQQDGVAGDMTQTYLFENPDVAENPERATATPVVTETPAATETPAPTATEAPAEQATIAPPVAQSAVPSPTYAPETEAAQEGLSPMAETVIAYNDNGTSLVCLRETDGVMVQSRPRVWRDGNDRFLFSLSDLAASIDGWTLSAGEEANWALTAEGYLLAIAQEDGVFTVAVDGQPLETEAGEVILEDGELLVADSLLQRAFSAEIAYDAEEDTLMLRVKRKDAANATD